MFEPGAAPRNGDDVIEELNTGCGSGMVKAHTYPGSGTERIIDRNGIVIIPYVVGAGIIQGINGPVAIELKEQVIAHGIFGGS